MLSIGGQNPRSCPLDDSNQPLPLPADPRVSGEITDHVAFALKFTFVNAEVVARYWLAKENLGKTCK